VRSIRRDRRSDCFRCAPRVPITLTQWCHDMITSDRYSSGYEYDDNELDTLTTLGSTLTRYGGNWERDDDVVHLYSVGYRAHEANPDIVAAGLYVRISPDANGNFRVEERSPMLSGASFLVKTHSWHSLVLYIRTSLLDMHAEDLAFDEEDDSEDTDSFDEEEDADDNAGDDNQHPTSSALAPRLTHRFPEGGSPVSALSFSTDGSVLAIGHVDGTLELMDPLWGDKLGECESDGRRVMALAFSPDGSWLAAGSENKTLRVWDAHTWQLRQREYFDGAVNTVAFSPDGRKLASGDEDKTIQVRDMHTAELLHEFKDHKGAVNSLAFSPDGRVIASGSDDTLVTFRSVETGEVLSVIDSHRARVNVLAFSPDGRWMAVGTARGGIHVWAIESNEQVCEFHVDRPADQVLALVFSPDSRWLVVADNDKTLWVYDALTREVLLTLPSTDRSSAVALSPDGRLLAVGGTPQELLSLETHRDSSVIDHGTDGSLRVFDFDEMVIRARLTPLMQIVEANGITDVSVRTILEWFGVKRRTNRLLEKIEIEFYEAGLKVDVEALKEAKLDAFVEVSRRPWDDDDEVEEDLPTHALDVFVHSQSVDAELDRFSLSPDGRWVAITGDRQVGVWDLSTRTLAQTLPGKQAAFNTDGHLLTGLDHTQVVGDAFLNLWEPASWKLLGTIPDASVSHFTESEDIEHKLLTDGRWIVTSGGSEAVLVRDLSSSAPPVTLSLRGFAFPLSSATISPDGRFLASGSSDDEADDFCVRIWDIHAGALLYTLSGHRGQVWSVAFSHDGRLLASASGDTTVRIWDVASGALVRVLGGHAGTVSRVTFSPCGGYLASASDVAEDGPYFSRVHLWNARSGFHMRHLTFQDELRAVSFSADARWLVTGYQNGAVCMWDVDALFAE